MNDAEINAAARLVAAYIGSREAAMKLIRSRNPDATEFDLDCALAVIGEDSSLAEIEKKAHKIRSELN